MRTLTLIAGGLAGLFSAGAAWAQPATALKWNLNTGNNFSLEIRTDTDQSITLGKGLPNQTQKQKQVFYFTFYPKGPYEKGWRVLQRIDRIVVETDIGGNKVTIDTAQPGAGNNPLFGFFTALVGAELELTFDNQFRITQVRGGNRLAPKLAAAPGAPAVLSQILTDDNLRQMNNFFNAIPAKPVAKGDRWNDESTLNLGPLGTIKQLNRYTYDGAEGKLHRIKNEPAYTFALPNANAPAGGLPFAIKKSDLKSTESAGWLLFDNHRGVLHSSQVEVKMAGTMSVEIGGQVTEMELTQTQKTVIQVNVK